MPITARLSRAVDRAVLWRLGLIGLAENVAEAGAPIDPAAFWAEARLDPDGLLGEEALSPGSSLGRRDGSVRLRLTGPSAGPGGHWGSTHLRAGALLPPDPQTPAVIALHGYSVPNPWYEERTMRQLHRRGLAAIRVELPFHLSRRLGGARPGHGFFGSEIHHALAVLKQAVEDVAMVAAWARCRGARAVGLHGVSLGGLVAALYAANRPVQAAAIITPPCDLARIIVETAPLRVRRRLDVLHGRGGSWGRDSTAARAALEELAAPVIPRRLRPRTPGDRIVLVVADHDLIVGADPVRELAAVWGTDLWSYAHGHVTVMSSRGLAARLRDRLALDLGASTRLAAAG